MITAQEARALSAGAADIAALFTIIKEFAVKGVYEVPSPLKLSESHKKVLEIMGFTVESGIISWYDT